MNDSKDLLSSSDFHHLQAAEGWLELGNYLEADKELDNIPAALRSHPVVLYLRYAVYAKAQKWDVAVEIAQALMKLKPDEAIVWLDLAYAIRRKTGGNIIQAREILTEAHGKFPDDNVIPYNLACYECQLGNLEQARVFLKEVFSSSEAEKFKLLALDDPDLEPLWKDIGRISD